MDKEKLIKEHKEFIANQKDADIEKRIKPEKRLKHNKCPLCGVDLVWKKYGLFKKKMGQRCPEHGWLNG